MGLFLGCERLVSSGAFWGQQWRGDGVCPVRSSEDEGGSLATADFRGSSPMGFNVISQSLGIHFLCFAIVLASCEQFFLFWDLTPCIMYQHHVGVFSFSCFAFLDVPLSSYQ